MNQRILANLIGATYIIGWVVDWSYWIAKDTPTIETGSFIYGAILAVFWPVHILVGMWHLIL